MEHENWLDVLQSAFVFGNTAIAAILVIRQSRNATAQQAMHKQNTAAIADLHDCLDLHRQEVMPALETITNAVTGEHSDGTRHTPL
jgi:hypothetical protein